MKANSLTKIMTSKADFEAKRKSLGMYLGLQELLQS